MSKHRSGFTLVELLVVISIISLLISLLLPALGQARAVTRTAMCQSGQRQCMLAVQMYANDFTGWTFPSDGGGVFMSGGPFAANARNWANSFMVSGYLPNVIINSWTNNVTNPPYKCLWFTSVPRNSIFSCTNALPLLNAFVQSGVVSVPTSQMMGSWSYGLRIAPYPGYPGEAWACPGNDTTLYAYHARLDSLSTKHAYMADSINYTYATNPVANYATTNATQSASFAITSGATWTGLMDRPHSDSAAVAFPDGHGSVLSNDAITSMGDYSVNVPFPGQ